MKTDLARAAGILLIASACFATETRTWEQSGFADFQKGVRKNLSIRSDGRLSLAPKFTEVYDSASSYLWSLARDSKGNLYTAGGPGAKLYRIAPNGKGEKIADLDALEIHAIAVDSKDHVYAATAPDGKVYRIENDGKSSVFYDPKQKYIWAMLPDAAGNLYIATGDQGEVHKVTPDGKGSVFFRSDETHMRSLALDREGNLIVGTEPGGLVIRVTPKGEGFVVYQMAKREVTSLAVGTKNEIYAAASGTKSAVRPAVPAAAPAPAPAQPAATVAPAQGGANVTVQAAPAPAAAAPAPAPFSVPGGSDIFVIPRNGAPERLWSGAQDVVYGMAFDSAGRLLIASGNKGNLYRLEDHSLFTTLVNFPVEQATALLPDGNGSVFVATANVGKVYKVGPATEQQGWIESDVFDSGGFASWGRLQAGADAHGGSITLSARSGNLDRPQENWSTWSPEVNAIDGGRPQAPAARFLQWRATLKSVSGGAMPTLDSVDAAYLRQNVAPRVEQIEITPYNYRFPSPIAPLTASSTLTLPAMGTHTTAPHAAETTTYPAMSLQKGMLGARWSASDENGDSLIYDVQIRGEKEQAWKTLREKVHEKYFSFDSTAFPDGDYRLRIVVSDSPSNTPEDTLSTSEESDPFQIDNSPPNVTGLQVSGTTVRWHAADAMTPIYKSEYSVDGGEWVIADPVGKLSDGLALDYSIALKPLSAGEHTIAVRVYDGNDNTGVAKTVCK
jgi:sugar lactone lactonase YvrE